MTMWKLAHTVRPHFSPACMGKRALCMCCVFSFLVFFVAFGLHDAIPSRCMPVHMGHVVFRISSRVKRDVLVSRARVFYLYLRYTVIYHPL